MAKHQEPLLVTRKILQNKIAEVIKTCTPIMSKPKPKPKKEEPKKDEKADANDAEAKAETGDKPADVAADADAPAGDSSTPKEAGEPDSKPSKMEETD